MRTESFEAKLVSTYNESLKAETKIVNYSSKFVLPKTQKKKNEKLKNLKSDMCRVSGSVRRFFTFMV
jgi:hypothetical protein